MPSVKVAAISNANDGIVKISNGKISVQKDKKHDKSFSFDGAYLQSSTEEVYKKHLKQNIDETFSGSNASALVYGTKNSEKEFLFGDHDETSTISGLVNLTAADIFQKVGNKTNLAATASMLQISNEDDMLDLLNPHTRPMKVTNHSTVGIAVNGLSEFFCENSDDLTRLHREGCKAAKALQSHQRTTIFIITLYEKPKENNQQSGPFTRIRFYDLCPHDEVPEKTGIKAVLNSISGKGKQVKDTNLSLLVKDGLIGNSNSLFLPCVSSEENIQDILSTLDMAKVINGSKFHVTNMPNLYQTIVKLRSDVSKLREKVSMQRPPKDSDLNEMEKMIDELNAAKRMDYNRVLSMSEQYYEERNNNYSHKGLLWILEGSKTTNHEKIKKLKSKLDQMVSEYRTQKEICDKLKEDLQSEIDAYSKQVEAGTTDDKDTKARVAKIHNLKEEWKVKNEKVKENKKNMKEAQEILRKEKDISMDFTSWSFEMMSRRLEDDYDRLSKDNKHIITEELDKMKTEIQSEKADLDIRLKSGEMVTPTKDELVETSSKLFTLTAEKSVVTTQLDMFKKENALLQKHIKLLTDKQKKEAEIKQLQNLQTFRSYREVFEEFKVDLENRWRGLLDESIQNAVFLNSRNSELLQENEKLKQEVGKLKDQLSIKG